MVRLYWLVSVFMSLLLVVILFNGLYQNPSRLESPMIGETITDIEGLVDLNSNAQVGGLPTLKRPYLIHIWSIWCDVCLREIPQFSSVVGDIPVIGIKHGEDLFEYDDYFDYNWTLDLRYHPLNNPFLVDLGVVSFPETYLVSGDGEILAIHQGALTEAIWEKIFVPKL